MLLQVNKIFHHLKLSRDVLAYSLILYIFFAVYVYNPCSLQAEMLVKQSVGPSSVKSLIRRHTVMRRSVKRSSTKSRKRNTSSSTTGPPTGSMLPFKASPFSFGSFSSGHNHRKGSAMSARSAPIPKSPKSSLALAQRRKSAFPEFGSALGASHRRSPNLPPHQFSTIHRTPHHHNPFSHLPPPRHRRCASTAIRQHLLPPLDRPPAPVPPESDLQVSILSCLEKQAFF